MTFPSVSFIAKRSSISSVVTSLIHLFFEGQPVGSAFRSSCRRVRLTHSYLTSYPFDALLRGHGHHQSAGMAAMHHLIFHPLAAATQPPPGAVVGVTCRLPLSKCSRRLSFPASAFSSTLRNSLSRSTAYEKRTTNENGDWVRPPS